jgi:hypothetical protein
MATMPDADLDFVTNLQQMVTGYIRGQQSNQPGGAAQAGPNPTNPMAPGGPSAGPMPPMPGAGGPSPMGGAMPGLSATGGGALPDAGGGTPGMPPMDELRRALGSSTSAQ